MRSTLILLLVVLFPFAAAVPDPADVRVLSWEDLLPAAPGDPAPTAPDAAGDAWMFPSQAPVGVVEELHEKKVRLPGFIVPLEMEEEGRIGEFLLVPYFGACIHYPPPPPNQTVLVRLKQPVEIESIWEPFWVTGTIRTESYSGDLASAGYTLLASGIEKYEY